MPSTTDARPDPRSDARCVLLVGGGAVPSNLVSALAQRGISAVITRTAPEVMAELGGGGVASVVVVEPERQDRAQELHGVAGRYHPGVRFWSYAPQAPGREAKLSAFLSKAGKTPENSGSETNPWYSSAYGEQDATSADTREPDPDPELNASPPPHEEPTGCERNGPIRSADDADDDPSRVTEQELAMLLGSESMPPPGQIPERETGSTRQHGRKGRRETGGEPPRPSVGD